MAGEGLLEPRCLLQLPLRRFLDRRQITDWLQLGGFFCLRANLDNLSASPRLGISLL